jgi:hypothetical protein
MTSSKSKYDNQKKRVVTTTDRQSRSRKRSTLAMTKPLTRTRQQALEGVSIIPQETTYNEWAETTEPTRTIINTETLMTRPFSTFKALRDIDQRSEGGSSEKPNALVWADSPLPEGEEEQEYRSLISFSGVQVIVGAVMGLLGHSLNSKEGRIAGVSLITKRRQNLKRQKQSGAFKLALPVLSSTDKQTETLTPFPFLNGLTFVKQPTWNDYACFQQRLLTGETNS